MNEFADENGGDGVTGYLGGVQEEEKGSVRRKPGNLPQTTRRSPGGLKNPIAIGVVLLIAGVSVAMIQYKVPTIMTPLMGLFAMSAQAASWLMSIFTLVGIFLAIPSGILARRFGAKTMMVAACAVAAAGSLIGILANAGAVLILSRAVEGCALTVLTTCGPILVRQCVPPERTGTVMGIWGIWGCIGSTVTALVVPSMFEAMGYVGVWTVFAVITLAAAVLVLVAIRVPKAKGAVAPRGQGNPGAADRAAPSWGAVRRAFFKRDVILFLVAFALYNILLLAVLSYVPTILQMQGFNATVSGLATAIPMVLSIVSSPVFGMISDRIDRVRPLLALALLVLGPSTLLLYTQTNALLWVGALLMGLIGMGSIGMFLAGYSRLVPDPSLTSFSMGVLICIQGVGQFLGSFLVQLLLGPDLTRWMFAGLVLLGMGLASTLVVLLCRSLR